MRNILLAAAIAACCAALPPANAGIVINEFLAENDGGLIDQDGDTPDWIELQNDGALAVDLGGWRLTDNATNLAKWTFPPTNIAAGARLIVFASGKNRATNGAQLHTSFQIDNNGGYLALVDSNGVVVSAFNYPRQHRNVSYGPGSTNAATVTLLASGEPARWWVPADGALGASWTTPAFNAASWSNAATPLRYEVGTTAVPGTPVLSVDFNDRDSNTVALTQSGFSSFIATNVGGTTAIQTAPTTRTFGGFSVTVSNSSAAFGYDDRARTTPVNAGALTQDAIYKDFIFSRDNASTNGLDVHVTGLASGQQYSVTVWSFDSGSAGTRVSDWFANGILVTNNYTFNGAVLPSTDTQNRFTFTSTASASGIILVSGRRKTNTVDTGGAATLGVFLNAVQFAPSTLVAATNGNVIPMLGANSSIYSRQSFLVPDPAVIAELTLRVKYNDGFVAYLNGTEVARRNAPVTPVWNSAATGTNSPALAEDIALPGAVALLATGTNVLAIQGLNISAGDASFHLEPQLIATLVPVTNGFFSPVTPGTANGPALYGVVADTKFSVDRGFFDAPFSLSITCATPGVSIYFTTNGSAPAPGNGFVHSAPISITGNSFIRAAAYLAGWVPSGVDTHSYIYLRDVLSQSNNLPNYPTVWQAGYPADYGMDSNIVNHPVYGQTISNDLRTLATLCIVSDQNGLWHSSTGIYPNPTSVGLAWERAASLELLRADGRTEFATTARINMHGNASRDNVRTPKHSLRVNFNSDYGPTLLDYDWFGGGVKKHDGIVLRSCGFVDGWAGRYADNGIYTSTETGEQFRGLRYRPENTCYLRDSWVKDSFRAMGWPSSRSAYVHLYLNGLYWGLYEPSERVNASYFRTHLGGDEGAWDVLVGEDNNGPPVIVDGSGVDWTNVLTIVNAGITNETAYQAVAALVDLDNLIDYMMVHVFSESEDWPRHNWFAAHRRATNGMPATKFTFTVWDQELTLDRLVRRNRVDAGNGAGGAGELYSPARVYFQLRNWGEFRLRFADRVHTHLFNNGALVPSNNVARLLASASVISNAVNAESARWGDARKFGVPAGQIGTSNTFTRNEWWQPEIDKLATNFFQKLTADNVARFRAALLYPAVGAPDFSQFGGAVTQGFALVITHTNAAGTIYLTTDGSDPRAYGSGAIAPGALAYAGPVPVNAPTLVRARVLDGATWSALTEAVFYPPQDLGRLTLTELMFNPPAVGLTNGEDFEFIELKNTGTNTLNLSGLTFSGVNFTFTNGTVLAPGAFFVLARNAAAFAAKYPAVPVGGVYSGNLGNGGESISLNHALGGTIFSVTFDDAAPWPVAADGYGFSLVQINPATQAPDDGARWRASTLVGGSPGADDPAPFIAPVVINEILTHTDLPAVDRIELFNPTGTNVDIGGWFLTDDHAAPKKFRIPNFTIINAGGFLSFGEGHFNTTPGTNGSFSLSSSGEEVYLFSGDADTNLTGWSHGVVFGAAANGVTFGRHVNSVGDEQFPAQIAQTFDATNSGPRVGPVVINEIHYHPAPGGDEFVELKNITTTNVALFDPARPTNTWDLNGLGFNFPTNVTLPGGALVLLVRTNPAAFMAAHSVPSNVLVLGPYSGALQQNGERLELRRPDVPDTNGTPRIVIDTVRYNDKAPWPAAADGSGPSLQRKAANQYGDDPANWQAAAPSPGRENVEPDTDSDSVPDGWEIAHGTNPLVPDANNDDDGDGFTNLQEYLAGTRPLDAQSRLHVERIDISGGGVQFQFTAASNRTFTVQFKEALTAPVWNTLSNVPAWPQSRAIVIDAPATNTARFFRLAVP
jgi:hypothetical protein